VVPFNSFSEFNKAEGGDIWFALDETRPLACFAGIWTNWTSVRKVKEGETTNDIFAFLTTEPNAEVGAIHPKAMPVILTTPDQVATWINAPAQEAIKPQRPLPDGALRAIARGVKEDPAPATQRPTPARGRPDELKSGARLPRRPAPAPACRCTPGFARAFLPGRSWRRPNDPRTASS
jgi:putative SOS response-associated peptidase YedK